ncbi:LPS export ABC transporter permease LptG [Candidatus Magnetaquicoccus inordinatus]|uniref:LPS export ABC transporter permease LptG n=1 Tax=Candidatus Magnetaquicoccus inordinatus TaxID=2496818 RepID=UPI00102C395E|nr:LPS export ABC transporter permease LptG [Candidatus Magnetaquicoccus inordinatus]
MPILFLYLLRLFLVGMGQIIGLFIGLFLLIDGIESIRRFALKPAFNWADMFWMMLCRLPDFITLLFPSITLLAVLIVLARLSRQNEITVMRASGISLYRILIPFLLGGLLIASTQLLLRDQLVPWSKRLAQNLEDRLLGQENPSPTDMDNLWLKVWTQQGGRQLLHVQQLLPDQRVLLNLSLYEWDADHKLRSHIQARSAHMVKGEWILNQGIRYQYEPTLVAERFIQLPWPAILGSDQLNRTAINPDFLTFEQLNRLIERTEREGYDATRLHVLLHSRFSQPATTLAAILLAFPFTLRLPRRGGITRSLLLGLLIGFTLFVVADLAQALGLGGRLPPPLAAWAPVCFFAGLGGFLLIHLADPKRQG